MRTIVEAIAAATEITMMVIYEATDADHRRAAERTLAKLEKATERMVTLHKEGRWTDTTQQH